MPGDRSDVVAIMAAIIYAGRTGESGQAPNEKVFGIIAKAAWDLHKVVVAADEVQVGRAGFQQP
jgi:4-aminobutyrate aminotransferase-like enzyme